MRTAALRTIVLACLVLGGARPVLGGGGDAPHFDEATHLLDVWLESIVDFDRLPGLSIAVIHDQDVVYARGVGYLDLGRRTPATPHTSYSICSISKLLTALAVMQLRDEGKLDLDDPVATHLPWFSRDVSPGARPPTIGDLLHHTGGLPCEVDHSLWSDPDEARSPGREDFIARAGRVQLAYPAGTRHNYSNLGYALLGEIVTAAAGKPYEDYVGTQILEPLGMRATMPGHSRDRSPGEFATGYGRWPRQGSRPEVDCPMGRAMTPAGGYVSTVLDLATLAAWQFRVLNGADEGILAPGTLAEMHTTQSPNPDWGYGFQIWQMNGKKLVGHQGGCAGYKSQFILCPEERLAVAVAVNATDAPQFTLAFRAFEIILDGLSGEDEPAGPSAALGDYVGSYRAPCAWSEAEVLPWRGTIAVLWVPSGNFDPLGSLERLQRVDGGLFRRIEGDGGLGKQYVFGPGGADGRIRMRFNNAILERVGD